MRTIITSLVLAYSLSASAQNIAVDESFGNDGTAHVENTSEIKRFVIDPNGNIISAGSTITGGNFHITLTKHDQEGTQDLSFGTGGVTRTNIAKSENVFAMKLQDDGKILVAGEVILYPVNGMYDFNAFVARYHPNGIIDSSFATNGIFRHTSNSSMFNSIILQSDQSILLGGRIDFPGIMKLTPAGAIDNAFGTNGFMQVGDAVNYVFIDQGAIRLNDGSILFYGTEYHDSLSTNTSVTCVKTDSLGNLITSFGQNGIASFDLDPDPSSYELLTRAQELPDGKIVLAGGVNLSGRVIMRLKADGTLDSTFAVNGVLHHIQPYMDMVVQPNGKIIIGGSPELSELNFGISVSRFNADGTVDLEFNGTGTFQADLTERSDLLYCLALTGPDQLLVGGCIRPVDYTANFALTRIDMSQSLGLQTNLAENISLYPNPVSDKLTISIPDESVTAIQLTDAAGRLISTHPAEKNTQLSLEQLPAGMYQIIFLANSQERISKKLIKN